jgi:hypothetical protein
LAFRLANFDPVFLDDDGNPCAGGSLTFTRTGTATAHNVFTNSGLGTSLGNVLTLDASGRAPQDFWMDSSTFAYRVVLKTAAAVTVWTLDGVAELGTSGVQAPDPSTGDEDDALFTDGVDYFFAPIRQVPDPTGHSGKVLGNDGTTTFWQTSATYDADNLPGGIEDNGGASGNLIIGNTMIQWGSDTCPTIGGLTSTKAVTFAVAFGASPHVITVTAKSTGVTSNSPSGSPSMQATNYAAGGFTATAFVGEENNGGVDVINSAVNFSYIAIGDAP